MTALTGFNPPPGAMSLFGMVGLDDVDRNTVIAVMVREGSGEPDIMDPTPEPPTGVNPERWRKLTLGEPTVDEAAVVMLGDRPEDDVLVSATYLVIQNGAGRMLPSLTVVCPFKPYVFERFPGHGRGPLMDEIARRAYIEGCT